MCTMRLTDERLMQVKIANKIDVVSLENLHWCCSYAQLSTRHQWPHPYNLICSVVGNTESQHPGDRNNCGAFPSCESRVFINTKPGMPALQNSHSNAILFPTARLLWCSIVADMTLFYLVQGRQKLARFNAHEFATLVIDILSDAKRRQQGNSIASPKGQHLIVASFQDLTDPEAVHRYVVTFVLLCYQTMLNLSWKAWLADIVAIAKTMTSLTTTVWHLMRIQIKTCPRAKEIGPRYRGNTFTT